MIEALLRGSWPVRARQADCALAHAVLKACRGAAPAASTDVVRPPCLFVNESEKAVKSISSLTAQRIASSAKAGCSGAVRAQARALALRARVLTRWGGPNGGWEAAGGCAADVVMFLSALGDDATGLLCDVTLKSASSDFADALTLARDLARDKII